MKRGNNAGETVLVGISELSFGQVKLGMTIKHP